MRTTMMAFLLVTAAGCRLGDHWQGGGDDLAQVEMADMADMADVVSVDMLATPDTAGMCGASGDVCCTGGVCNAGLACLGGSCAVKDVFAINGLVQRWNGSSWTSMPTLPVQPGHYGANLSVIWGSSATDIWTVGAMERSPGIDQPNDPATYHWDGSTWTYCAPTDMCGVPASAPSTLTAIYGLAAADIWVVGTAGAYHWNGSTWSTRSTGLIADASSTRGLWCASTDDCWTVGESSTDQNILLQRWNGSTWTKAPTTATNGILQRVFGFGHDDAWAIGNSNIGGGALLLHWDGVHWSTTYVVPALGIVDDIWGAASNDVWVVGASGQAAHWDGSGWTATTIAPGVNFRAIWGASSRDLWVAGDSGGAVLHYNGSSWTSTQASGVILGLWGAKP